MYSVTGDTHYVDATNTSPVAPYTDWACAATNIQDAVDMADSGDTVMVGPGMYHSGGRAAADGLLNRVTITNAITLRSMQGAGVTTISAQLPPDQNGDGRIFLVARGVWLAAGARVDGFTVTGGNASDGNKCGGGVFGSGPGSIVANCVLSNNVAFAQGGGIYGCTAHNCAILFNFTFDIILIAVPTYGGGAGSCTLRNCLLYANYALGMEFPTDGGGGGAYNSVLCNCTVTGNQVEDGSGGGVLGCSLTNCIVTDNNRHNVFDWLPDNHAASALRFSCASPLAPGEGNVEAAPVFENDTDFHLQSSSPCINAGTNLEWMAEATDLDGMPRIADGRVDMGAFESNFIPTPVPVPYWWLSLYPILISQAGGSYEAAALADTDGDGYAAWQEYVAGSVPTNSESVLRALIAVADGVPQVTWAPDLGSARVYTVEGRTNLIGEVWGATNAASRFFRVRVDMP